LYSKSEGEMVGCVSRDENKQRGSGKYDDKHVISGGVRREAVWRVCERQEEYPGYPSVEN